MPRFDYTALAHRRDEMNLTNKKIADLKGLSESTVSRILRGETKDPSFDVVAQICDVLDFSMDSLVGKGAETVDIPEDAVVSTSASIRLLRDHIARIISHIRAVEHEKDLSYMDTITILREQLNTRTNFMIGSFILNFLLMLGIAALIVYDFTHLAVGFLS